MDLVQKRQQLRQRQVEKVKKFRQSNMSTSAAVKKQKEREEMKKEVRKEIEKETQKESMDIENSDGTTFARVMDIIGPTHMRPVVSNGLWKGTEQITEKKSDCECDDCGQDPCIECGESHHSVKEAKVEAGRSDYGKASVRNKRKFGKEGEPAVFDASGERGKMIDQRRAEHKAKRGVKEDLQLERTGSPSTTGDMNSRFWSGDKNTNYTTNITKGGQGAYAALGAIGGAAALHYGTKAAKSIGKSVKKTKDKIKSKFKKEEYSDWRSEIDEGLTAGAIGTAAALGVVGGAASAIGNMSTRRVAKKLDKKKKTDEKKKESYDWREDKNMRINRIFEGKKKGLWDNIHAKRKRGEKPAKPGDKDYPKTLDVDEGLKQARKNVGADTCWDGYKAKGTKKKGGKEVPNCVKEDGVNEGAAWTKKSGKSASGGLNEKGRKSYERENPGSDLKAPQPEGGSRKKSFCARMGGMKKKLTSSKTANDPDSRINKALRKWKC